MLFLVKSISPKKACITVRLMITLIVDIFEVMWTQFALFGFQSW